MRSIIPQGVLKRPKWASSQGQNERKKAGLFVCKGLFQKTHQFDRVAEPATLLVMNIVGHGIDLVEIDRIDQMLQEHGDRFLARCFTEAEARYGLNRRRRAEHLAGRFAAKEAILKAFGTGWRDGIAWVDMEILNLPSGQPQVTVYGRCQVLAQEMGINGWWISISHTARHAMASVIATSSA